MPKSQLLVFIQFSAIAFFLYRGGWLSANHYWLAVAFLGIAIGLWAIWAMRIGRLSVFPEPKERTELVERGPYRWIRHPMYTAVLLVCAALAYNAGTWLDASVWCLLFVNQWIKLRYEEALLTERFEAYANYMERTKALIPYFI